MLQELKKLTITVLTLSCVISSSTSNAVAKYLKIKDNISVAKIYQKQQNNATFVLKNFLKNKHNRVFIQIAKENNASVCKGNDIILVDKIGWVCASIFDSIENIPDKYIVYGQQSKIKKHELKEKTKYMQLAQNPRYATLRNLVESSKPQFVEPDKVSFVVLSKNYTNSIVCSGKLQKIIFNKEHKVELEHDKHNIFVKAPHNKLNQFLSDMLIKCDGSIYQLNIAYDAALPSQKIILKNPDRKRQLESYKNEIDKFVKGMNYEVRISNILKIAYNKNYPPFWIVEDKFIQTNNYNYLRRIDTGIQNIIIHEFMMQGSDDYIVSQLKNFLQSIKERYIALGIVRDKNKAKVYLATKSLEEEK